MKLATGLLRMQGQTCSQRFSAIVSPAGNAPGCLGSPTCHLGITSHSKKSVRESISQDGAELRAEKNLDPNLSPQIKWHFTVLFPAPSASGFFSSMSQYIPHVYLFPYLCLCKLLWAELYHMRSKKASFRHSSVWMLACWASIRAW